MPLLVIPNSFTSGTVAQSAQVNANFQAVVTLLNTTGIDSTNVQQYGLSRDRVALGTANHVVINDGAGALSSEAALAASRGGLGISVTLSPADAGKTIGVNDSGTAFELRPVVNSVAASNLFIFSRFI